MNAGEQHEILTAAEVAQLLRVAERTIYDWASKGILPAAKIESIWRFRRSEVTAWLERRFSTKGDGSIGLRDVLTPDRIMLLDCRHKKDALDELIDCLSATPEIRDPELFRQAIFEREKMMSTGIGLGIGLPHVRLASVTGPVMAVGKCLRPLDDYASLDGKPVEVIFMIATRSDQHAHHIRLLAAISQRMKNSALRELLSATESPEEYHELLVRGA